MTATLGKYEKGSVLINMSIIQMLLDAKTRKKNSKTHITQ